MTDAPRVSHDVLAHTVVDVPPRLSLSQLQLIARDANWLVRSMAAEAPEYVVPQIRLSVVKLSYGSPFDLLTQVVAPTIITVANLGGLGVVVRTLTGGLKDVAAFSRDIASTRELGAQRRKLDAQTDQIRREGDARVREREALADRAEAELRWHDRRHERRRPAPISRNGRHAT